MVVQNVLAIAMLMLNVCFLWYACVGNVGGSACAVQSFCGTVYCIVLNISPLRANAYQSHSGMYTWKQ
jgi:hypothetical protein